MSASEHWSFDKPNSDSSGHNPGETAATNTIQDQAVNSAPAQNDNNQVKNGGTSNKQKSRVSHAAVKAPADTIQLSQEQQRKQQHRKNQTEAVRKAAGQFTAKSTRPRVPAPAQRPPRASQAPRVDRLTKVEHAVENIYGELKAVNNLTGLLQQFMQNQAPQQSNSANSTATVANKEAAEVIDLIEDNPSLSIQPIERKKSSSGQTKGNVRDRLGPPREKVSPQQTQTVDTAVQSQTDNTKATHRPTTVSAKPNAPITETITSQSRATIETSKGTAKTEKPKTEQKGEQSKNTPAESESGTSSDSESSSGTDSSSSSTSESGDEQDVLNITEKVDLPGTDDNEAPRKRQRFTNSETVNPNSSVAELKTEPSTSQALIAHSGAGTDATWSPAFQAPQVQLQQSFAAPNSQVGLIQAQLMQMQQFQLSLAQLYSQSNQTSKKASPNINIHIDNSGRRSKPIPKFSEEEKAAYNQEKQGLGKNARRRLKRRITSAKPNNTGSKPNNTGSKPYQRPNQRQQPPPQ